MKTRFFLVLTLCAGLARAQVTPVPDVSGAAADSAIFATQTQRGQDSLRAIARENAISILADSANSNFVNVKNYGAQGDGVTNDLPSILVALDSAFSQGKGLYFPRGTYAVGKAADGTVMIPMKPGMEVFGDGDESIVLRIGVSGDTTMGIIGIDWTALDADSTKNNYTIRNIKFVGATDGRRSGYSIYGGTEVDPGVQMFSGLRLPINRVVLDHVTASGFNKESIGIWDAHEAIVTNCKVINANHSAYNMAYIRSLRFTNNLADSVSYGLEYVGRQSFKNLDTTDLAVISDNIWTNVYTYGICLAEHDNVLISNNIIYATPGETNPIASGVFFNTLNTNGNGIRNTSIIGNRISGFYNSGIGNIGMTIADTNTTITNLSIKDNVIDRSGHAAISLYAYDSTKIRRVDIIGNTFHDWNTLDESGYGYCGIYLEKVDSVFISGNTFRMPAGMNRDEPITIRGTSGVAFVNNDCRAVSGGNFYVFLWEDGVNTDISVFGNAGLWGTRTTAGVNVTQQPTFTELNYVSGVTSAIQTQLDAKEAKATVQSIFGSGVMDSLATSDTLSMGRIYPGATADTVIYDAGRTVDVVAKIEMVDSLFQTAGAVTIDSTRVTTMVTKVVPISSTLTAGKLLRIVFVAVSTEPKYFEATIAGHH